MAGIAIPGIASMPAAEGAFCARSDKAEALSNRIAPARNLSVRFFANMIREGIVVEFWFCMRFSLLFCCVEATTTDRTCG
jgi:hypothetical protein